MKPIFWFNFQHGSPSRFYSTATVSLSPILLKCRGILHQLSFILLLYNLRSFWNKNVGIALHCFDEWVMGRGFWLITHVLSEPTEVGLSRSLTRRCVVSDKSKYWSRTSNFLENICIPRVGRCFKEFGWMAWKLNCYHL